MIDFIGGFLFCLYFIELKKLHDKHRSNKQMDN